MQWLRASTERRRGCSRGRRRRTTRRGGEWGTVAARTTGTAASASGVGKRGAARIRGRGAEAEGVSGVSGREARGIGGRWRPLHRLVHPVGDRSPYNEHTELVFPARPPSIAAPFRLRRASPSTLPSPYSLAVSFSPLLPCPFALARPLAASPRAPERRAAELAAGKAPVTFWSRGQARCTPHLA